VIAALAEDSLGGTGVSEGNEPEPAVELRILAFGGQHRVGQLTELREVLLEFLEGREGRNAANEQFPDICVDVLGRLGLQSVLGPQDVDLLRPEHVGPVQHFQQRLFFLKSYEGVHLLGC